MYPSYNDIEDRREREALEALDHPDGEESPGDFDCYREYLFDKYPDDRELREKYERSYWQGFALL